MENKSDANLEDSDCTVRMLLFVSIKLRINFTFINIDRKLYKNFITHFKGQTSQLLLNMLVANLVANLADNLAAA